MRKQVLVGCLCALAINVQSAQQQSSAPSVETRRTAPTSVGDCSIRYPSQTPHSMTYAMWVCDGDGKSYIPFITLYATRTNRGGILAVERVWSGDVNEWSVRDSSEFLNRFGELVNKHQKENAHCSVYFHVAGIIQGGAAWNRVTPNMEKWWTKDGVSQFPSLCYTSDPGWADFVVFWSDARFPITSVIPLPQTSSTYGFGTVGGTPFNYFGSTTGMQLYNYTRTEWHVMTTVVPVESDTAGKATLGTPLHWSENQSKMGWSLRMSKPDKDTLQDAMQFIARQSGR